MFKWDQSLLVKFRGKIKALVSISEEDFEEFIA